MKKNLFKTAFMATFALMGAVYYEKKLIQNSLYGNIRSYGRSINELWRWS